MKRAFILFLAFFGSLFAKPYVAKDYSYLLSLKDFDTQLLEMHFKLYQGYVNNTNLIIKDLKTAKKGSQDYFGLKRRLSWEFNGMRLHEYYFENIALTKGNLDPNSPLYKQIEADFGSFDNWKRDFIQTGLLRGIGWVVLYFDREHNSLYNIWIDDHNTGNLAGQSPILIMDVWEHAYITQFGLDRQEYILTFLNNVDWNIAITRFYPLTFEEESYAK